MPKELKQPSIPSSPSSFMTEEETRGLINESFSKYGGVFRVLSGNAQSGNFVTGSTGWSLDSGGDLEANSGTFRGTITATGGSITGDLTVSGTLVGGSNPGLQLEFDGSAGQINFYYDGGRVGYLVGLASGDMALDSDKNLFFSANGTQTMMIVGTAEPGVIPGDVWLRESGSKLYWSSGRGIEDGGSYLESLGDFRVSAGSAYYVGTDGGDTNTLNYKDHSGNNATATIKGGIVTATT